MQIPQNETVQPIKAKSYVTVFFLLIALTALTLLQPMVIDLSLAPTLIVQMGLATAKAFLIVAYYMHIKTESRLLKTLIYASLVVLVIVYVIMAIDTYYRYTPNDFFALIAQGGFLC
ncbi:MAG: cytochrome C oxidase subunit IV family protein [Campylobacterales bacterium]|nr:cytochrome C oxidase subunit IV family protein [Campylobacterales bacterium]